MQKQMKLYDEKKLEKIRQILLKKEQTIAVAESVTAGLLQSALAQAEEASNIFQGGITAYNLGQKFKHLNVDPIHAQLTNSVSGNVAVTMALSVCALFGATWGLGITGYATPVPESAHKIFAFYAIARDGKIVKKGRFSRTKKEDPFSIQLYYTTGILDRLLEQLK
jgi:nicotinamide-nucleotide amidase